MYKIEVLVATMNQTDLSLFYKMNIQTDVIFCNQCDRNEFVETEINGCRVRMLSSTTRGVGINRNLAMQLSSADICICADDDVVYVDGYEEVVQNEYKKNKKADIIGFNFQSLNESRPEKIFKKSKRTKKSFGGCSITYRNNKIKQRNVSFSTLFGGGCIYSSGEDSLFCKTAIKKGLRLYSTNIIMGTVNQENSSWFRGYTEKFYFDKGAWCRAAYPTMWRLLKYYLVIKQTRKSELSYVKVASLMNQGAKAYKTVNAYSDMHNTIE